jgi:hypothetical protein
MFASFIIMWIVAKKGPLGRCLRKRKGVRRTNDTVLRHEVLGVLVQVRDVQQSLGGNASNVEASSSETASLLNASDLTKATRKEVNKILQCTRYKMQTVC